MLTKITAAQKRAGTSYRSDASAQTQKITFLRFKRSNKKSGHVFLNFMLLFNIAVEEF